MTGLELPAISIAVIIIVTMAIIIRTRMTSDDDES